MSKRVIGAIVAAVLGVFLFAGCDTGEPSGQDKETKTGQSNYDRLVEQQPAVDMEYSATRDTINFFTETWGEKGKTAYVYLMNNEGTVIGYYVTAGPPVSMCTSIRPTYQIIKPEITGDNNVPLAVPAPGADAAYYSGGECNTYYAKDANTGAYIQFTAGMGINPLIYDQPLTPGVVGDAPNLGNVEK